MIRVLEEIVEPQQPKSTIGEQEKHVKRGKYLHERMSSPVTGDYCFRFRMPVMTEVAAACVDDELRDDPNFVRTTTDRDDFHIAEFGDFVYDPSFQRGTTRNL